MNLITEDRRLEERDFWPRLEQLHPQLLGALLDLTADVLAVLPSVCLETHPRMADFARILAAVDYLVGTDGLARYSDRAGTLAEDSLTGDTFVTAMGSQLREAFEGTSAELHAKITPAEDSWRAPKGWPTNTRQVTTLLKRQAPIMRRAGWIVDDLGSGGHTNTARWRVAPPEIARIRPPQPPPPPQGLTPEDPTAGLAGLAEVEYGPSEDVGSHDADPGPDNGRFLTDEGAAS